MEIRGLDYIDQAALQNTLTTLEQNHGAVIRELSLRTNRLRRFVQKLVRCRVHLQHSGLIFPRSDLAGGARALVPGPQRGLLSTEHDPIERIRPYPSEKPVPVQP